MRNLFASRPVCFLLACCCSVALAPPASAAPERGYRWEVRLTPSAESAFSDQARTDLDTSLWLTGEGQFMVPLPGFEGWWCVAGPELDRGVVQTVAPDWAWPTYSLKCSPASDSTVAVTATARGPLRALVIQGHAPGTSDGHVRLLSHGRELDIALRWVPLKEASTPAAGAQLWLDEYWEQQVVASLDGDVLREACDVAVDDGSHGGARGRFSIQVAVENSLNAGGPNGRVLGLVPGASVPPATIACVERILADKLHPSHTQGTRVVQLAFVALPRVAKRARKGDIRLKRGKVGSQMSTSSVGTGKVDRGGVSKVFSRRKKAVQHCYEKGLQKNHNLAGKVVIKFTIGPGGRLAAISVLSNSTGDASVGWCIISKVRTWRFPAPVGGSVTFKNQFVLSKG